MHKVACKHPLDSSYAQATHNLTQRVSMAGIKGAHFFLGAIPASFPDVALTPTIKPFGRPLDLLDGGLGKTTNGIIKPWKGVGGAIGTSYGGTRMLLRPCLLCGSI